MSTTNLASEKKKGAVTFDETEKARGKKKKVPLAVKKTTNETV